MRHLPVAEEHKQFPAPNGMLALLHKLLLYLLCLALTTLTIPLHQVVTLLSLPEPCLSHIEHYTYVCFGDGITLSKTYRSTFMRTFHTINQPMKLTDIPLFFLWYVSQNQAANATAQQCQHFAEPDDGCIETAGGPRVQSAHLLMFAANPCYCHPLLFSFLPSHNLRHTQGA